RGACNGGTMDKDGGGKCGRSIAAAAVALFGLLAGCAQGPPPAPVVAAPPPQTAITLTRGPAPSGNARHYNVAMGELADGNQLSPPYRILAGGVLLTPAADAGGPAAVADASRPGAATPAAGVAAPPAPPVAVAALPPRAPSPPPETLSPPGATPAPIV